MKRHKAKSIEEVKAKDYCGAVIKEGVLMVTDPNWNILPGQKDVSLFQDGQEALNGFARVTVELLVKIRE